MRASPADRMVEARLHCSLVLLHPFHRRRLMLFGRMRVSSDHNDLRVTEHRGERHEINARLSRTSRPSVAQIVKPELSHAATIHSSVMCRVYFDDRFTFD